MILLWREYPVYIGETGETGIVNIRMKEHQRDVRLKHITQSALPEHNIETGYQILFDKTITIATTIAYNSYYIFLKKVQGDYRDTGTDNLERMATT